MTYNENVINDYVEFYLAGYDVEYRRLVALGDAWRNTNDEKYRQELHAEAELLRELTRLHKSITRGISWTPVMALNNVLENNNAIYASSENSGVPVPMIAGILYQESLFRDIFDNMPSETVIAFLRGDASFGIGQVRAQTAIAAENAFLGDESPKHSLDEMMNLLQESNATNIKYVGMVLWHCGQMSGITINSDYDYSNVDKVFQNYNPGSSGYGRRVSAYTIPFYDYYNEVMP